MLVLNLAEILAYFSRHLLHSFRFLRNVSSSNAAGSVSYSVSILVENTGPVLYSFLPSFSLPAFQERSLWKLGWILKANPNSSTNALIENYILDTWDPIQARKCVLNSVQLVCAPAAVWLLLIFSVVSPCAHKTSRCSIFSFIIFFFSFPLKLLHLYWFHYIIS